MIKEYIWTKEKIKQLDIFPRSFNELSEEEKDKYISIEIDKEYQNNKKKGLLLADIKHSEFEGVPDIVSIGFSLCNKKDKYDNTIAVVIARNRLRKFYQHDFIVIPFSIQKQLERFIERCRKYYKVDDVNIMFSPWINDFIYKSDNWEKHPDYNPYD